MNPNAENRSQSTAPALELRGIEKSFGTSQILSGVNLSVAPGEFIALVGPSGCGKSTLLRIAAGLEQANSGEVRINGKDVSQKRAADRDMAMVFQSYALYPHLTARQNMALPLVMRRMTAVQRLPVIGAFLAKTRDIKAAIKSEIEAAADILKITALLDRKPAQMSGGQRQRVALGRALVRHPSAFLMDEPLSNLDAALRVHMRAEIVELHRKAGVVTLYVTHDQEEALGMADRVAVMMGGRILQLATPEEIYRNPSHIDVACFIGSPRINLLPIVVNAAGRGDCGVYPMVDAVEANPGSELKLGIRPEHLEVHEDVRQASLPVKLERVEFLGAEALLHMRADGVPDALIARVSPQNGALLSAKPSLNVSALSGSMLMFDGLGNRVRQMLPNLKAVSAHAA